jgi:hypothetical protein
VAARHREGILHRNPVNRELLALAARSLLARKGAAQAARE